MENTQWKLSLTVEELATVQEAIRLFGRTVIEDQNNFIKVTGRSHLKDGRETYYVEQLRRVERITEKLYNHVSE